MIASRLYFYYSLSYEQTGDLAEIRRFSSSSTFNYIVHLVMLAGTFSHCIILQPFAMMSWVRYVCVHQIQPTLIAMKLFVCYLLTNIFILDAGNTFKPFAS